MKKVIAVLAVCLSSFTGILQASDLIQSTLLDHVSTVTQFKSGETKIALMDSVVLIGSYKGHSLLDLQLGLSSETNAEPGEPSGGSFIYGGLFKVSSLTKGIVEFPEHWKFLNAIEHGVSWVYDSRAKDDYVSYQVGLAFGLNPKL